MAHLSAVLFFALSIHRAMISDNFLCGGYFFGLLKD